jgi:hypothetical protein
MEGDKLILESNIMLALLKATIEQSEFLRGELRQRPKQVFNTWSKLGHSLLSELHSLLSELEKKNIANEDYLNELTDVIHNVMHEIRKRVD